MTAFSGTLAYPTPSDRPVLAIGNFDGVHLGHRALLEAAKQRADSLSVPIAVLTFDPAPVAVLRPDKAPPRIISLHERIRRLEAAGVRDVVVEPFSHELANRSAEWFATEMLGRRIAPSAVIVGWDFRFGHQRQGDVAKLREWLAVPVDGFGPFELGGSPVSSSRIRALVADGDVRGAAELLGRPHEVVGLVVHGDARGRTIGFPTANVNPETLLLPKNGVYAVRASGGGLVRAPAVMNIGVRPTVDGLSRRFEVHVFDVDVDLYGQALTVELVDRIRDEQKFASLDALVAQIHADAAAARTLL